MIVLITPTGARQNQFRLCAKWMTNQTYTGQVLWIIVDDWAQITTNNVAGNFRENWTIVKDYPVPKWSGTNTQARNIKAGVDILVRNYQMKDIEAILIIEDDDYYRPCYLTEMMSRIGNYDVIGETNTIYYNVHYRLHCDNNNREHSSLFQTALTPKSLSVFQNCYAHKFIDAELWSKSTNKLLFHAGTLSVGIKGMPGRGGIGAGHGRGMAFLQDPQMIYLRNLIGEDANEYAAYYGSGSVPQHPIPTLGRI
jgi:hypothetical protein